MIFYVCHNRTTQSHCRLFLIKCPSSGITFYLYLSIQVGSLLTLIYASPSPSLYCISFSFQVFYFDIGENWMGHFFKGIQLSFLLLLCSNFNFVI